MKKYLTLTSMQIKNLLPQGFYNLVMKPTPTRQDHERMVSASTQKRLRVVAHQRLNEYNPLVSYKRRFG
jgi:hypothetical protein